MSKPKKYKALIIGAGRIASGYDNRKKREILTHAHAYALHPKIDLLGFYDLNQKCSIAAAKKWSVQSFYDLRSAIVENKPDIISICTPNENHFDQLRVISTLASKPKIIICEKPLASNISDAKKIIKLYNKIGIPILVDHSKRFDKTVQQVRQKLLKGELGKISLASAIYGQGILHSGTHIIDLARYFFGEMLEYKILFKRADYKVNDPTIGAFIKFKNCEQFYLQAGDSRQYDLFQFDIIGEKGRICFTDLGFKYFRQKVINDPLYAGYKILNQPQRASTNFDRAMFNLIDNAVQYVTKGQDLICDMHDALKTMETCQLFRNKLN